MILPPYDLTATAREQCELLASFVKCAKPEIIVEAGTYLGHGAVWLGSACRANGRGHVYTADPIDHAIATLIEANGLSEWVTYHKGDYLDMIHRLDGIGLAYIDASAPRDARPRTTHFNATLPKMASGGMVFMDDTKGDHDVWLDGEGGASRDRLRARMTVNFEWLRGLSLWQAP